MRVMQTKLKKKNQTIWSGPGSAFESKTLLPYKDGEFQENYLL